MTHWFSEADVRDLETLMRRATALSHALSETNSRAAQAFHSYAVSGCADASQARETAKHCWAGAALLKEMAELFEQMSRFAPVAAQPRRMN